MKLLRRVWFSQFVTLSLLVMVVGFTSHSHGYKLDVFTGGYSLEADNSAGGGSSSGAGLYRLSYLVPVFSQFEVGLGYTLISSQVVGGDLSFGFDVNGYYYPLSRSRRQTVSSESVRFSFEELWRPYVGVGFHQRQFQSVSTNYAGFGGSLGVERAFGRNFSWKADGRYILFYGPDEASATELGLSLGLSFHF